MEEKSHYRQVVSRKTLWKAWQAIRENGRASKSLETQNEVRQFDQEALTGINRLSGRLGRKSFKFAEAKGIEKRKSKGSSAIRPIVMAPINNRIVQRAILDVIQADLKAKKLFDSPNSFGGLLDTGVRDAVLFAQKLILEGKAKHYICSDISKFFTDIRRASVVKDLAGVVEDKDFVGLFEAAVKTELVNLNALKNENMFPIHDIGVAQGCCLSPLVGNIYLRQFDAVMNTSDVYCLRYIDDFLILGPTEKVVNAKFRQAEEILKDLGLSVYHPSLNPDKASKGTVDKGFDYLGCFVSAEVIRPSKKSWQKMESSVKGSFDDALRAVDDPKRALKFGFTFSSTIQNISRRMEGWTKQYQFCTDERIIGQWNHNLRKEFLDFENRYFRLLNSVPSDERARLLGYFDIERCFLEIKSKQKKEVTKSKK